MIKKHMKRLNTPKTWPIKRKGITFITRLYPGKKYEYSMSLNNVLRDFIKISKTSRENKYLLKEKQIIVDGKRRFENKFPVGLMDVISLPEIDEHYRMVLSSKGKLAVIKIDKKESEFKISKIIGKNKIKGKTQLNLLDSRNILIEKDNYKVGDSVVIEMADQKIKSSLKFEKGAYVLLTAGKYGGMHGVVEDIAEKNIIINLSIGKKVETSKNYAFVLGKEKPEIKLP